MDTTGGFAGTGISNSSLYWLAGTMGILARILQTNEEDAYLVMQRESRQRRKSMKEIAEAILLADEITGPQDRSNSLE